MTTQSAAEPPTIQLDDVDARETVANMMKSGHWTAHQTLDGKRLVLRYRKDAVRTLADLRPPTCTKNNAS